MIGVKVTIPVSNEEIIKWTNTCPKFSGDFGSDINLFQKFIAYGELLLSGLSKRDNRDANEHHYAETIHFHSRNLRFDLLSHHCEHIYEILTEKNKLFFRLDELAYKASEIFDGLTPTISAMNEETNKPQLEREAREFDQAIFVHKILRSNKCGNHLLEAMRRPLKKSQDIISVFHKVGCVELDKVILQRQENGLCYVTIQNDEHLNSEDDQLMNDLEVAVDLVNLDSKTLVGIMRGGVMKHPSYSGRRVFSAGINLKYLGEGKISFLNFFLGREMGLLGKIQRGLSPNSWNSIQNAFCNEKPWLAVVDTFAIGGGAQLLLAFDKVIAASDSYIILPAANEGFIPGAANLRLTRFCGSRLARHLIFDGKKLRADQEESKYFFDRIEDQSVLDEVVEAEANLLTHPATVANRRMLMAAEEPQDHFREYMADFCLNQIYCLYNKDIIQKIASQWSRKL